MTASWGFYRMSRVARSSSAQCYLKVIYKSNPREPAKPVPHALIRGLFYSENIIEPARKKLRDPDFPYYRALAQSLQVQDGRSPGVVSIECFAVGDAGEVLDEVINSFESFIGKPEFYSAKKIRSALESEIEECKDAIHREELRLDQLDPIWRNKVHPDPQTQSTIEEIAQLELGAAKQLALIETAGDAGLPDTLARISDLRWKVTSAAAKRSQPAMRASTEFFIQTSYLNALQKTWNRWSPRDSLKSNGFRER